MTVAVLYARPSSIYKRLPGTDVWDATRDARKWPGGSPCIAHPPCRGWGRLRHFAKIRHDELDLARSAVAAVRQWGGVLEHPDASQLWPDQNLPRPGCGFDAFGGWTLAVPQRWFGHRADKATWLYIVGVRPGQIPTLPFTLERSTCVVERMGRAEREATPPALAKWLVELAASAQPGQGA